MESLRTLLRSKGIGQKATITVRGPGGIYDGNNVQVCVCGAIKRAGNDKAS